MGESCWILFEYIGIIVLCKKNVLHIVIFFGIFLIPFLSLFYDKWFGSNWDDAIWYIYMANKYIQWETKSFIIKDELLWKLIEQDEDFTDPKYYHMIVSNRYKLVNTNGTISPRYPLWLWILLAHFSVIHNLYWIYLSNGLFLIWILIFLCLSLWNLFKDSKTWYIAWLIGSLFLFSYYLFQYYGMVQPMREIPAILFISIALYLLIKFDSSKQHKFFYLSILFFWFWMLIRETMLLFWLIYLFYIILKSKFFLRNLNIILISFIVFFLSIWPYVYIYVYNILNANVGSVVWNVWNLDHIWSVRFNHFRVNYKNYLSNLWIINIYNYVNYILIVWVFVFLVKKTKLWLWIIGFCVTTFILFSSWPNPFDRYILPIFFFKFFFIGIGIAVLLNNFKSNRLLSYLIISLLLLINLNFYQRKDKIYKSMGIDEFTQMIKEYEWLENNAFLKTNNEQPNFWMLSHINDKRFILYSNYNNTDIKLPVIKDVLWN